MLYLETNKTNPISVDAPQISEPENTFYFFVFENIQTQDTYSSYVTRTNVISERFGAFNIVIPTDFGLHGGMHEYKVYSAEDELSTDTETMQLLEVGYASVLANTGTNNFYDNPDLTGVAYDRS